MDKASIPSRLLPLIAVLGIVTGFDALAIDMYLPALVDIAGSLEVEASALQASLSVFLGGLALGQFVAGPIADRFGRRWPLLMSIVLFIAASIMVATAESLDVFLVGRALQGIGGAAGLVIPRIIVAELFDGRTSAKVFSLLMQVMMIAPIAAPPLGGVLLAMFDWQAIFWALALISAATLVVSLWVVPETLLQAERRRDGLLGVFSAFASLIRNRRFAALTLSGSFTVAGLFVYIGASAFIFVQHFGVTPVTYSLLFAGNAVGMIIFGQVNVFLLNRWQAGQVLPFGLALHAAAALTLLTGIVMGVGELTFVVPVLFLAVASLSLVIGNITALVMQSAERQTGSASSLFGVAQYALAGIVGAVLSAVQGDSVIAPAVTLLLCALASLAFWWIAIVPDVRSRKAI